MLIVCFHDDRAQQKHGLQPNKLCAAVDLLKILKIKFQIVPLETLESNVAQCLHTENVNWARFLGPTSSALSQCVCVFVLKLRIEGAIGKPCVFAVCLRTEKVTYAECPGDRTSRRRIKKQRRYERSFHKHSTSLPHTYTHHTTTSVRRTNNMQGFSPVGHDEMLWVASSRSLQIGRIVPRARRDLIKQVPSRSREIPLLKSAASRKMYGVGISHNFSGTEQQQLKDATLRFHRGYVVVSGRRK